MEKILKKEINYQQIFIEKIKKSMPNHLSLVDELAILLDISNDSAYRRIRGETLFNIEEIIKICQHFRIPLNFLEEINEENVSFKYQKLYPEESSFESYLNSLLEDLKKIRSFESRNIIYASKDIPVFHHFLFPELGNFKIFFWRKSVLNSEQLINEKFSIKNINPKYSVLGKEILQVYNQINSTEIWTEETFNSTLKQIEYFFDNGYFEEKKDAIFIAEQFAEMLIHIKYQAGVGSKFMPNENPTSDFQFYFSEVMIGNNNILVKLKDNTITYLSHNTLNYLMTNNADFCKETEQSIQNLIKKSSLISATGEKLRNQFFAKIQDAINALISKMNA